MKIQCPAKINLFLEITGVRRDGYHRLATLFAKINLYDVLDFSYAPDGTIELDGETAPGIGSITFGKDNLIYRAARAFYRLFNVGQGVHIHLAKRIPIGAGLGGGSSDAAGTLLGLQKYFKIKPTILQKKKLKRLAASLGADVPFFLHPAVFCLGTGIGDRLKAVHIKKSLPYMVLVYPRVPISTAAAYKNVPHGSASDVLTRVSHLDRLTANLRRGRPIKEWENLLFNRLESADLPDLSRVAEVRDVLSRMGARGVRMSGSGSSVFGFVSSHEEGEKLAARLSRYPWSVFLSCCNG